MNATKGNGSLQDMKTLKDILKAKRASVTKQVKTARILEKQAGIILKEADRLENEAYYLFFQIAQAKKRGITHFDPERFPVPGFRKPYKRRAQ